MQSLDLELVSTADLISEILRRKTFLGVIITSQDELRGEWVGVRQFACHFNNNLVPYQVKTILECVSERLESMGT